MMKSLALTATFAFAATSLPAAPIELPRFTSVELVSGGEVVLRHGPAQRVSVAGANAEQARLKVDARRRLTIDACPTTCRGQAPRIEIVTPAALEAVAIRGGGLIRGEGNWPAQGSIAVAVAQGGEIDLLGLRADTVTAAVTRGGAIRVAPRTTLVAVTSGGGRIGYRGDPAITRVTQRGGTVERIRD